MKKIKDILLFIGFIAIMDFTFIVALIKAGIFVFE